MSDRRSAERDFDALYRAQAPRVVHLIYASTGDLTLAQDCTQEAYSRAWQRWSEVSTYDDPGAWVRTVARRLAISAWRKRTNQDRAHVRHGRLAARSAAVGGPCCRPDGAGHPQRPGAGGRGPALPRRPVGGPDRARDQHPRRHHQGATAPWPRAARGWPCSPRSLAVAEQQTWSVEDDAVVRAALDVLRRDVQERPLADAAFVRARGDARRRHRRVTVALASAAAAVAVGYVGVQALVEPTGRVVGPVGRPTIAVSAPTGAGGTGATTGAADPSVPLAVPGPLPVAQEYQRALGLRGRVVVSDLKESEGAVLDCPQVRSPGVRVAGQSVTSVGPGVYGDQGGLPRHRPGHRDPGRHHAGAAAAGLPDAHGVRRRRSGSATGAPQQRAGQRAVVRHHPLRRPGRAAQRRPDPDQPDVALDDGAAAGPRRRGPAAAAERRGCAGDHAARPALTSGAGAGAAGPPAPQEERRRAGHLG